MAVLQSVNSFVATTLSAFYFDIVKDHLYCDGVDDARRQAVIATLHHVSYTSRDIADVEVSQRLMKIIAPITPHLSEELYSHSPTASEPSVFLDLWHRDVSMICGF